MAGTHTRVKGKEGKFYRLMRFVPMFWGHSVRGHSQAYQDRSYWVLEPGHDKLNGADIYYDTVESVYSGELLEDMKAEMKRRLPDTRTYSSAKFVGFLYCASCGNVMQWTIITEPYTYYRCRTPDCESHKFIKESDVQDWITAVLEQWLASGNWDIGGGGSQRDTTEDTIASIEAEIADVLSKIETLVIRQAEAGLSVADVYAAQIARYSEQHAGLERRKQALLARKAQRNEAARQQAIHRLETLNIAGFWQQDNATINRELKLIFGEYHPLVMQGEIVSVARL